MRTRRIVAIVLAFIALPLLALGLIDPLEGGIALLAAIVIGVVIWAFARVRLPALLWVSLILTVAVGALTIGLAILENPPAGSEGGEAITPPIPLVSMLWVWRAGVLVVAAGAILYIVRLFQSLRNSPAPVER